MNLIPFMPKEGEEVPNFSTIFYDKEKKRIVKRTEKKVETGGKSRKMITNKTLVYGTDADPRLIARVGVALTQATEDNVDRAVKKERSTIKRNTEEGEG